MASLKGLSGLTKGLIVLVVVLAVAVIVLGVLLIVNRNNNGNNSNIEYCTSDTCIESAAKIISSIDKTVSPCDDFYQYACGSWIADNTLPDRMSWDTFSELGQQIDIILKREIEKPISASSIKAEQKAKMFYSSCMDANNTIESLGAQPMLQLLDDIGGWSISNKSFNISKWTLQEALQTLLIEQNGDGLFQFQVGLTEIGNSSINKFQIIPGGLFLTSAMYTNSSYINITNSYLNYLTQIGTLLGGDNTDNSTSRKMQNLIKFETDLAKIIEANEVGSGISQMTIAGLQKIAPYISWIDFFSYAAKLVGKNITDQESIAIYNTYYFSNLSSLITSTEKDTLNNYLVWHTIQTYLQYLSKDFRDAVKELQEAISGTQSQDKSWSTCLARTSTVFGFVLGRMYVDVQFPGDSKTKAQDMIERIRTAFEERLSGISWLDQATRALAKEKADAITEMIGYPDYIMNNNQLDEQYKDLEVNENRYFQNMLNYRKNSVLTSLKQLGTGENKTSWLMTPQTVNAYYEPTLNQIVFPAAILQKPFYDKSQSQSLNFGGIGMVMGHEITHGFDNSGRQYDKDGVFHQWWNNATIGRFENQTVCMVSQYSNYMIDGIRLDGENTLGENIADNGGLKEAYQAYADWTSVNGEERPIMGLNFTHKQLLFLGFAQNWCAVEADSIIMYNVLNDVHSIPKFRVNGVVSNFPEFSTQFNCPSGSNMNPVKKCEVW